MVALRCVYDRVQPARKKKNQGLKAREQCVVIFPMEQKQSADSLQLPEPAMNVYVCEAPSVILAGSGKYE